MRTRTTAGLLAGLLAAALFTALPGSGATAVPAATVVRGPGPARAASTPIVWRRCQDSFLRSYHAKCGKLTVPLDPADPSGPTIQVGVSRVLHTKSPYRGAVFTNPGGPGGSGLFLAAYGAFVPQDVGLTYDWYGFDPRGVGSSVPRVSCQGSYNTFDRPSYDPITKAAEKFWLKKTAKYATACGGSAGAAVLAHDTTADTVADYEVLRQAIGEEQITWYGASYGTYIGEVYATLHPDRIKAMVLDGVIDPDKVWYRSNLDQDPAFQKTFDKFLAWVGKYPHVYHLGSGLAAVKRSYLQLHQQLATHPALGKVGPDELDDALLGAAYYNITWLDEANALSRLAVDGDAHAILRLYRGQSPSGKGADNGYADYLGVQCSDAPWPTDWATWAADNTALARKAPFFTWGNAWFNAPCRTWPFPASPPISVSGASLTAPILMTEQSLDPATPYPGALSARAKFPSARLVVGKGGTSHAVALFGVSCTDNAIADLLRDGKLPARKPGAKADRSCPPLTPPTPGAHSRVRVATGLPWRRFVPYLLRAQRLF